MNPLERRSDVLAFDVRRVMGLLRQHPSSELVMQKVLCNRTLLMYGAEQSRQMAYEMLVNEFICFAINSYQEIWIAGYNKELNTQAEIAWFNLNVDAWSELWEILRPIGPKYAGVIANFYRAGGTIWLQLPID